MFITNEISKSVSPVLAVDVAVFTSGWCCNLTVKFPLEVEVLGVVQVVFNPKGFPLAS